MKKNKYILMFLAAASLSLTGCREDFAEINTDPSAVTDGNPSYLFAQGVLEFEPQDYTYWFYNAAEMYQWAQIGVNTGGVTSSLADGAPAQDLASIDLLKYANEIKASRAKMSEEESARYAQYAAALDVLCVYMGIFDSDFIGNIPYNEGGQGATAGILTPKYDRVEDLYNQWLADLDKDIEVLTTAKDQIFIASQDVVYNGDVAKWAKLANSLKLKIAARLISQDKAKALSIAKEVASASCGVIDGEADDFLFNKALSSTSSDDYTYHWGNDVLEAVGGSKTMIDFLVGNMDPRVRFIFEKNEWNSKVVQLFFDAKRHADVPKYVMDNMDYEVGADGIYKFKAWKGAGEPWVRYYGLPLDFNAAQQTAAFGDWFDYKVRCRYDASNTYLPYSMFQREMLAGRLTFRYPTLPGDAAIEDRTPMPWWGMYMTTAEVNLYLAEFALLGAALPQNASTYFDKAVRASIKEYDRLGNLNKIPYYGTTYNYDPLEATIDLKDGEMDVVMAKPNYKLTGDKATDLEKIYIQQIIHFSMQPIDLYSTARRSGVPVIGSDIFNRKDYGQISAGSFPRRMSLSQPSPTDLMYNILIESYNEQGFSVGTGSILNTERLWQDIGAPQWGAGPKF